MKTLVLSFHPRWANSPKPRSVHQQYRWRQQAAMKQIIMKNKQQILTPSFIRYVRFHTNIVLMSSKKHYLIQDDVCGLQSHGDSPVVWSPAKERRGFRSNKTRDCRHVMPQVKEGGMKVCNSSGLSFEVLIGGTVRRKWRVVWTEYWLLQNTYHQYPKQQWIRLVGCVRTDKRRTSEWVVLFTVSINTCKHIANSEGKQYVTKILHNSQNRD
jgi:hypothetical protein